MVESCRCRGSFEVIPTGIFGNTMESFDFFILRLASLRLTATTGLVMAWSTSVLFRGCRAKSLFQYRYYSLVSSSIHLFTCVFQRILVWSMVKSHKWFPADTLPVPVSCKSVGSATIKKRTWKSTVWSKFFWNMNGKKTKPWRYPIM